MTLNEEELKGIIEESIQRQLECMEHFYAGGSCTDDWLLQHSFTVRSKIDGMHDAYFSMILAHNKTEIAGHFENYMQADWLLPMFQAAREKADEIYKAESERRRELKRQAQAERDAKRRLTEPDFDKPWPLIRMETESDERWAKRQAKYKANAIERFGQEEYDAWQARLAAQALHNADESGTMAIPTKEE